MGVCALAVPKAPSAATAKEPANHCVSIRRAVPYIAWSLCLVVVIMFFPLGACSLVVAGECQKCGHPQMWVSTPRDGNALFRVLTT